MLNTDCGRLADALASCIRLNRTLLAGDQSYENFSDGVILGSVDKRVGAGIRERYEQANIVAGVDHCQVRNYSSQHIVDICRQPGDSVECTDKNQRR